MVAFTSRGSGITPTTARSTLLRSPPPTR